MFKLGNLILIRDAPSARKAAVVLAPLLADLDLLPGPRWPPGRQRRLFAQQRPVTQPLRVEVSI